MNHQFVSAITFNSALIAQPRNTLHPHHQAAEENLTKILIPAPNVLPITLNRETRRRLGYHHMKEMGADTKLKAPRHERRTSFTSAELTNMSFPEQVFTVDGLLPRGLVMLAGAPKLGKSWAALDLAVRIASGQPFLDRPVQQGAVLYLALEDTPRRLAERIKLVAPDVDLESLLLEFWIETPRLDEGGLESLEQWLKKAQNPSAIVIDIWGRIQSLRGGPSRNSYEEVTAQLQPLQALANKYGVTVLLIHHTKKTNGDTQGSDPFDAVLGSRALTSNMDATMMLTRSRFQQDATLSVTGRDIEEAEHYITFNKTTCRWETSRHEHAPALPPERQQIIEAVESGLTKSGEIATRVGKSASATSNLLTALVNDGYLIKHAKGVYGLARADELDNEFNTALDIESLI